MIAGQSILGESTADSDETRSSIRAHQSVVLAAWRAAMGEGDDLRVAGLVQLAHALHDADAALGSELVEAGVRPAATGEASDYPMPMSTP